MKKIVFLMALLAVANIDVFGQDIPTEESLKIIFDEEVKMKIIKVDDSEQMGEIHFEYSIDRPLDKGGKISPMASITVIIVGYQLDSIFKIGSEMVIHTLTSADKKNIIEDFPDIWPLIKHRRDQVFIATGKTYYKLRPQDQVLVKKK